MCFASQKLQVAADIIDGSIKALQDQEKAGSSLAPPAIIDSTTKHDSSISSLPVTAVAQGPDISIDEHSEHFQDLKEPGPTLSECSYQNHHSTWAVEYGSPHG